MWMQEVYVGGDPGKHGEGVGREVSTACVGGQLSRAQLELICRGPATDRRRHSELPDPGTRELGCLSTNSHCLSGAEACSNSLLLWPPRCGLSLAAREAPRQGDAGSPRCVFLQPGQGDRGGTSTVSTKLSHLILTMLRAVASLFYWQRNGCSRGRTAGGESGVA